MKLMLDTNASKENIQDGNIVSGQCDIRAAVRMFGSGQSINNDVKYNSNCSGRFSRAGLLIKQQGLQPLTEC